MPDKIFGLTREEAEKIFTQLEGRQVTKQGDGFSPLHFTAADFGIKKGGLSDVRADIGGLNIEAEARARGKTTSEYLDSLRSPFKFLAPGVSATPGGATSVLGTSGTPSQVATTQRELGSFVTLEQLAQALGKTTQEASQVVKQNPALIPNVGQPGFETAGKVLQEKFDPAADPAKQLRKDPVTGKVVPTQTADINQPKAPVTPVAPEFIGLDGQPNQQPTQQTNIATDAQTVDQVRQVEVQEGDTLSGIASRLGVPMSSITGFRSGDPNLIFPGEILTVGQAPTTARGGGNFNAQVSNIAKSAEEIAQDIQSLVDAEEQGLEITPETTVQQAQEYLDKNDISTVSGQDFKDNPLGSFETMLDELYEKFGFSDIQNDISETIKDIDKINDKLAEEIEDINENPWISEALRSAKVRRANEKSDLKKAGLSTTLSAKEIARDRIRDEVRFRATSALDIFQAERQFAQDQLEFIAERAEKANELDTQVVEVGGRKKLINKKTGETIADLGAAKIAGAKAATPNQNKLATFATRTENAGAIIDKFEKDIQDMNFVQFTTERKLPSTFQSDTFQQFDQAARNFINATLRVESGAAISDKEFDNAEKQYLPRAGDSDETLRQKKQNRDDIFEGFKKGAGPAFTPSGVSAEPSQGEGDILVLPDGSEFVKGEDGLYYSR